MYCLFLSYSFIWASAPLFCLLCVSFWTVPLAQTWGNCWLFVFFFLPCYLVLLDHPILLLFWRGLPGDDDGSPIVPTLCHCNLTRRGTGGWGGRQKKKKCSYMIGKIKPKCLQSLPAFSVQFSCQNFFCEWLKLMWEQMTNYQIYDFFNLKHHFAKCKCFLGKSKQLFTQTVIVPGHMLLCERQPVMVIKHTKKKSHSVRECYKQTFCCLWENKRYV